MLKQSALAIALGALVLLAAYWLQGPLSAGTSTPPWARAATSALASASASGKSSAPSDVAKRVVSSVRGRVEVLSSNGRWSPLEVGTRLLADDRVRTVVASVGHVDELVRDDSGHYSARYTLPQRGQPQYAIIAVIDDSRHTVDWGVVQLDGMPRVKTKSVPGATVHVRVAGRTFGPWIADHAGRVPMRVVVPPGVDDVQVIAEDRAGTRRSSTLSLGLGDNHRTLVVCPDTTRDVYVFAVGTTGKPSAAAPPTFTSSAGNVSSAKTIAPGAFRAQLSVAPSARAQGIEVVARFGQDRPHVCTATMPSVLPLALSAKTRPSHYRAGTNTPIGVSVALRLTPNLGRASTPRTSATGSATITWTLPDRFGGRSHAKLRIGVVGAEYLSAQASVALEPGAASTVDDGAFVGRLGGFNATAGYGFSL